MKVLNTYVTLVTLSLLVGCFSTAGIAKPLDLSHDDMMEVIKIAKSINAVSRLAEESKYIEFAMGIQRASARYGIPANILIAITQQETGFRENLPEGKAGEIGICQIRKMWLQNPRFISEFGRQTIKDLKKPSKSFLFAAWILKGLRESVTAKGTLPWWSFYNSVRFENRFKYFLAVNRNIATLKRLEPADDRILASDEAPAPKPVVEEKRAEVEPVLAAPVVWAPRKVAPAVKTPAPQRELKNQRTASNRRWIPDALMKVSRDQQQREAAARGQSIAAGNNRNGQRVSPSVMRAASELDVTSFLPKNVLAD